MPIFGHNVGVLYTYADFDAAAARLLGERIHQQFLAAGMNRPTICEQVAKLLFIGTLQGRVTEPDLAVVRWVAANLWHHTGEAGLC